MCSGVALRAADSPMRPDRANRAPPATSLSPFILAFSKQGRGCIGYLWRARASITTPAPRLLNALLPGRTYALSHNSPRANSFSRTERIHSHEGRRATPLHSSVGRRCSVKAAVIKSLEGRSKLLPVLHALLTPVEVSLQ